MCHQNIEPGKSNKAADALSHHPLSPDLPPVSDTDSDEVNVISYPLVCDDSNDDNIKTTSYSSVYEKVNWHLGTIKISNDLKVEVQTISCVVEPLINEERNLEIIEPVKCHQDF